MTQNTEYALLRDITAADLGMDSPELGEGYSPDDVIGPKGSTVRMIVEGFDLYDLDSEGWVEVTDFANDSYAVGFVRVEDLTQIDSSGADDDS